MTFSFWLRTLAALSAAVLVCSVHALSCVPVAQKYIQRPRMIGNQVVGEVRIGAGVACYRNGVVGPPSFLVADLGKPGVPRLSASDLAIVKRFADSPRASLRFIHLPLAQPKLVVFIASLADLCNPTLPPFKDLTGSCNQYYSPLEDMDRTSAAPGC